MDFLAFAKARHIEGGRPRPVCYCRCSISLVVDIQVNRLGIPVGKNIAICNGKTYRWLASRSDGLRSPSQGVTRRVVSLILETGEDTGDGFSRVVTEFFTASSLDDDAYQLIAECVKAKKPPKQFWP